MLHPLPRNDDQAIDLSAVKHMEYDAGDVIAYLGGSLLHGVMSWRRSHERRAVPTPPNISLDPVTFPIVDEYFAEQVLAKAFPRMHSPASL
eukprot:COSAG04_NODE_1124_length_8149_cov_4.403700_2_plen_91_part_00